jgi:2-phosphoglycolate phosphatase
LASRDFRPSFFRVKELADVLFEQNFSRFKAVVFDFDGTLADSYDAITASVNHVRHLHGLDPLSEPAVRRFVGRGPIHLLQHTVPGANVQADLEAYKAHHPSVLRSGTRLLPGVAETVAALANSGFSLAICSNKLTPFTCELLDYLGLAVYFQVVIGPEDAPRPKPAPDMLVEALKRLNCSPAEALYVGDMTVDIETARAAGVFVWTVSTGSDSAETLAAANPDRLLSEFRDLKSLLIRK